MRRRRPALFILAALLGTFHQAGAQRPAYLPFLGRMAPMPLPAEEPIRWVGEVAGPGSALAVDGPAAYLGEGHGLVVVDLADPKNPRRVGRRGLFGGYVQDIAISGGLAYVAAGAAGLQVMDLTEPLAPRLVGTLDTPGDARAVAVHGSTAWVADGPGGLRSVDVSIPSSPRAAGAWDTIQDATGLALQGSRAYVTIADARTRGMLVIDVADPQWPRELSAVAIEANAVGIDVAGRHAYLACGESGLFVMDISDPARPGLVSVWREPAAGILVSGDLGFAPRTESARFPGLQVLDLANPTGVRELSTVNTQGHVASLAVDGEMLHLVDHYLGLTSFALDASGLAFQRGHEDRPSSEAGDVAISGHHGFVMGNHGLQVLDIAAPDAPLELGTVPYAWPPAFAWSPGAGSILALGPSHAYLALPNGLNIVDVSDPAASRKSGVMEERALGQATSATIVGSHLYVAGGPDLRVFDIAAPTVPREVGRLPVPGGAEHVASGGDDLVHVSSGTLLQAVSVATPSRPRLVGSLMVDLTGDKPHHLAVVGRFAYIADPNHGDLIVVDVADPTRMRRVGALHGLPSPRRVTVHGQFALVVDDETGLHLVDVSTPAAPRIVGSVDTPGDHLAIAVAGGHAYLADGSNGLQVFQVGSILEGLMNAYIAASFAKATIEVASTLATP